MVNTLSTVEQENVLDIKAIGYAFIDVIDSYFKFLQAISYRIKSNSNEVEREKRKSRAIKNELLTLLVAHREFYLFKKIELLSKNDDTVIFEICLNYSDTSENFLRQEDLSEFANKFLRSNSCTELRYTVYPQDDEKIIEKVKEVQRKTAITNEDILQFLKNGLLVEQNNIQSNCLSYKELQARIDSRKNSYDNRNISIGRINNMSFKFQENTEYFEGKNSCERCSEDFEEDQEICRLPCNHLCCRKCTEEMFAIPEDDSKANECRICGDDCS